MPVNAFAMPASMSSLFNELLLLQLLGRPVLSGNTLQNLVLLRALNIIPRNVLSQRQLLTLLLLSGRFGGFGGALPLALLPLGF
ncbi:MAG: hypothetical protein ACYC5Y_06170 [Symbiobacteriia bacterium]